jgi:cellulose synthase/poly-beta-1,6-N-acetylglucosamine synthase-like glycosyltransferase
MLILVPSHDDAEALARALPSMVAAVRPGADRIVVVADRCTDETADVASRYGVEFLRRDSEAGGRGKAGALAFALSAMESESGSRAPVAVLDADSRPEPGLFAAAQERFDAGARALQADVAPLAAPALLSRIAAYSEIVSQAITGRLRSRLGWGVALRGTGMVVEHGALARALSLCRTEVEDLEITLLLAAGGIRIERLAAAVGDPKPDRPSGLTAQRARWLAGNAAALSARRREIGRLCRSVEGLTLVLWLFARPRSLFFCGRLLLLAGLALKAAGPAAAALEAALALLVVRDVAELVGGLWIVDRPLYYLPAVLASPFYPLVWAAAAVRSFRARRGWLSARRPL